MPQKGDPVYAIYAFPLARLDTAGNPVGYKDGKLSNDYGAITGSTDPSAIKCVGSAIPQYYGSITHTVRIHKLVSLTVQVSGRFSYFYRSATYTSSQLIAGANNNADYNDRWQQKGDENKTPVPAFTLEENKARDRIWQYGDVQVRPADQVRLDYVQLGFTVDKNRFKFLRSGSLLVYLTLCNLGILWRKNKQHQDPDAVTNPYPAPKTFGITIKFMR